MTSSTGAVVERYRYDAYGKRTVTNAAGTTIVASSIGQQRGFTGYYLDAETGIYYARARMYSPAMGRFIGRDPLGYVDGYSEYGAFFAPNGLDPMGTKRVNGKRAAMVSWIGWSPIDEVRQGVLDAWIRLYGPGSVNVTVSMALAGATLALYSGYNPDPQSHYFTDEFEALVQSREYRAISRLKPWIECDCNDQVTDKGQDANYIIGFTPQYPVPSLRASFMYTPGQGTGTIEHQESSSCVTFVLTTKFMVNELEQKGYQLVYGVRLPYAWNEITYQLCCNGSSDVSFTGSKFPSHAGYIDGTQKWISLQHDYGEFGSSGGYNSGQDPSAPGIQ